MSETTERPSKPEDREEVLFLYLRAGGALQGVTLAEWLEAGPSAQLDSVRAGARFWDWLLSRGAAAVGAAVLAPEAVIASTDDNLRRLLWCERALAQLGGPHASG